MTKSAFGIVAIAVMSFRLNAFEYARLSDALAVTLPAVALGATLYRNDRRGTEDFVRSAGANLAATATLKYITNLPRPDGGRYAFPSGHTSVAFHSAGFIHRRYGLRYAAPLYIGAAVTGYSRIRAHRHVLRDVVAGAALGAVLGYTMTQPHGGVIVYAGTSRAPLGVTFSKRW
jgi:membrane-associated phospholipid phosphatase